MDAISQTTLSCVFLWMKMLEFFIGISLKFVPMGPINNNPSLVQIMAWRRPGDKPLSEPMMVCLPTHICVTRPQWVNGEPANSSRLRDTIHASIDKFAIDPSRWRHNERDGVSNYQPYDCLLNRLFRRRYKKRQSSTSLALVRGIHRWPVNSPHNGSVTRKMFPFDDVIMHSQGKKT